MVLNVRSVVWDARKGGGARCADVFAGAKGVCLRQGVSRSEVESVRFTHYRTLRFACYRLEMRG